MKNAIERIPTPTYGPQAPSPAPVNGRGTAIWVTIFSCKDRAAIQRLLGGIFEAKNSSIQSLEIADFFISYFVRQCQPKELAVRIFLKTGEGGDIFRGLQKTNREYLQIGKGVSLYCVACMTYQGDPHVEQCIPAEEIQKRFDRAVMHAW